MLEGQHQDENYATTASGESIMNLRAGVLPFQWLRHAACAGWITAPSRDFAEHQWQPSSLDLRLGPVAYRMRSSFLPGQESVEKKIILPRHV